MNRFTIFANGQYSFFEMITSLEIIGPHRRSSISMSTQTDKKPILYNMELPSTIEEVETNEDGKSNNSLPVELYAIQPEVEQK